MIADRTLLLSSSADISEQKVVEDQLFRSAYYDELTDLPYAAGDRASRQQNCCIANEPHVRFALAFLDIDNFKHINDYYGHIIGDALLVEVWQAARDGFARIRHAIADQRRRIPAAAQSGPEPA